MTAPAPGSADLRERLKDTVARELCDAGPGLAIGVGVFERIADALIAGPLAAEVAARAKVEADLRAAEDRAAGLLLAFHDAIRRPLGVTPDSGAEFWDPRLNDEAEERRPRHGSPEEIAERPESRIAALAVERDGLRATLETAINNESRPDE